MTTSPDLVPAPPPSSDQPLPSATLGGEQRRSVEQITLLLFFILPVTLKARYLLWGSAILSLVGTVRTIARVTR